MTDKRFEFVIKSDGLWRYTPINDVSTHCELIIPKAAFIECYRNWIQPIQEKRLEVQDADSD